jgi:hypothetical protein
VHAARIRVWTARRGAEADGSPSYQMRLCIVRRERRSTERSTDVTSSINPPAAATGSR